MQIDDKLILAIIVLIILLVFQYLGQTPPAQKGMGLAAEDATILLTLSDAEEVVENAPIPKVYKLSSPKPRPIRRTPQPVETPQPAPSEDRLVRRETRIIERPQVAISGQSYQRKEEEIQQKIENEKAKRRNFMDELASTIYPNMTAEKARIKAQRIIQEANEVSHKAKNENPRVADVMKKRANTMKCYALKLSGTRSNANKLRIIKYDASVGKECYYTNGS